MEEEVEYSLVRTQITEDYQPDKVTNTEWEAIREDCVSGGNLDESCNIVAASLGTGKLEVVSKRLSCGCILVKANAEEAIL